jgi:hypothetical protein
LMFGGGRHNARVYTTDDTVIDETTATYLRTRLLESLGLPEGKDDCEAEVGVCDSCRTRKVQWSQN